MALSITDIRFNVLAGYAKGPYLHLIAEEIAWLESENQRVLAVVVRDLVDDDFMGVIMGRDSRGRFRAVKVLEPVQDINKAVRHTSISVDFHSELPEEFFYQGDESGSKLELFSHLLGLEKCSREYLLVCSQPQFAPARAALDAMMYYFDDVDGTFIEQFRGEGFSQRIWELYLYAAFTESGCVIDRSKNTPDYNVIWRDSRFFVEATTINESSRGKLNVEPKIPKESSLLHEYIHEYMPIKFGSALTSKLKKEYWNLDYVNGHPFCIAIQSFHEFMSMMRTMSALPDYLYGIKATSVYSESGVLTNSYSKIERHSYGVKSIPSGFFYLPGSENISGVITNPHGTVAKFNRMGYQAGFGRSGLTLIRRGTCYDWTDNASKPRIFEKRLDDPSYRESWIEGMTVYHNPRALYPLDPDSLPGAAHVFLRDNELVSYLPEFFPYSSITLNVPQGTERQ